ncbi:MAG: hypothetical protein C4538_06325 [Nitrospiraceae bacterium]|nr:MAG: hypothetical protein C4538_06325 [Nitrospiraceae bacterium]
MLRRHTVTKAQRHKDKAGEGFLYYTFKKRLRILSNNYVYKMKRRNVSNSVDYRNPEPACLCEI